MAYTGIFCTEAEIEAKEGANVSTDVTETMHNAWASEVESTINATTRYNWSDAFSGLNADVKAILSDVASSMIAIYSINYDMGNYNSRGEAESMVTILRDSALRGMSVLREIKSQTFVIGA